MCLVLLVYLCHSCGTAVLCDYWETFQCLLNPVKCWGFQGHGSFSFFQLVVPFLMIRGLWGKNFELYHWWLFLMEPQDLSCFRCNWAYAFAMWSCWLFRWRVPLQSCSGPHLYSTSQGLEVTAVIRCLLSSLQSVTYLPLIVETSLIWRIQSVVTSYCPVCWFVC